MANFQWPSISVSAAPIQFIKDGVDEFVESDSVTPANSNPLPVLSFDPNTNLPFDPSIDTGYLQAINADTTSLVAKDFATEVTLAAMSAKLPATLGQTTKSGSVSVTMASDQDDLPAKLKGVVSTGNSSTTPLAGGATFTGTSVDTLDYGVITVGVFADQASSSSGLKFLFSTDNTNWFVSDQYTIVAGALKNYSLAPAARYFKVSFANGAVSQTQFFLETVLKQSYVKSSSHRIGDPISGEDDAELVTAQLVGMTTAGGGSYVSVKVNPSGALTADVTGTVKATQSGTWDIVNVSGTISLPTGASTLAEQQTQSSTLSGISGKLPATLGQTTKSGSLSVTVASDDVVAVSQSGTWNINNISGAITLPTGAATSALQSTGNNTLTAISNKLPAFLGQTTANASLSVVVATDQNVPVKSMGRVAVGQIYHDYASSNVTTAAYTEILASVPTTSTRIEVFDSSGQTMILAFGLAGFESDQMFIFPGGNGAVDITIYTTTRLSIKAKTETASEGYLAINLYE